MVIFPMSKQ